MITIINTTRQPLPRKRLHHAIECVVKGECYHSESITAVYCGDVFIKKINRTYLQHDYATDTISFRLNDGKYIDGEFYISLDTIARNARRYKQLREMELLRVTIHSVLHLIGYNDETPDEKTKMTHRENHYLDKLYG
jgi:probable rRNA maturation factor